MRVLITGATGLVGKEIVSRLLNRGDKVNFLTTNPSKIKTTNTYKGFYWNPQTREIDVNCFKDVTAIINLAGATISKRWTKSNKAKILSSRIDSAKLLITSLKKQPHTVKHIVSASAIGVYPDSLTNYYNEKNIDKSNSFLGEVVQAWENTVGDFSDLNIIVSKIRIGIVLSKKGGALQEMLKPIKLGLGAAFGKGKQWQSWIHIEDLANQFIYLIDGKLEGVYNGVAPNSVTNEQLTKMIASVLKKPLYMPNTSKLLMKLLLGEMHILLFESQRVSSKKIENKGFKFKYYHLKSALESILLPS